MPLGESIVVQRAAGYKVELLANGDLVNNNKGA
jgi:hypothetical protein